MYSGVSRSLSDAPISRAFLGQLETTASDSCFESLTHVGVRLAVHAIVACVAGVEVAVRRARLLSIVGDPVEPVRVHALAIVRPDVGRPLAEVLGVVLRLIGHLLGLMWTGLRLLSECGPAPCSRHMCRRSHSRRDDALPCRTCCTRA